MSFSAGDNATVHPAQDSDLSSQPIDSLSLESLRRALDNGDREHFAQLAEEVRTEQAAMQLIAVWEGAAPEDYDVLAVMIPLLAQKGWQQVNDEIKHLAAELVLYEHSRVIRKTFISALQAIVDVEANPWWNSFFKLFNTLEETQFHLIEPALPMLDALVSECEEHIEDGTMPPWIHVLLIKSMTHSNGWLRMWAIKKVLYMDVCIIQHYPEVVLDHVLPALNGIDALWRSIYNDELQAFIQQLGVFLTRFTAAIDMHVKGAFFKCLLEKLTARWNPCALFVLSLALRQIDAYPVFTETDFPLFSRVLETVSRQLYEPLRLATTSNLINVFITLTCWCEPTLWEMAVVLAWLPWALFEHDVKSTLQRVLADPSQSMIHPTTVQQLLIDYTIRVIRLPVRTQHYATVAWLLAEIAGLQDKLMDVLCEHAVRAIQSQVHAHVEIEALLSLWLAAPNERSAPALHAAISDYIESRVFQLQGSEEDMHVWNSIYKPLAREHLNEKSVWAPLALSILNNEVSNETHALLLEIANTHLTIHRHVTDLGRLAAKKYLAEYLFQPLQTSSKSNGERSAHERSVLELILLNRVQLSVHLMECVTMPFDAQLDACCESLREAHTHRQRAGLVTLMHKLVPLVSKSEQAVQMLQAVRYVVLERAGKDDLVQSTNWLLQLCLNTHLLSIPAVLNHSIELLNELLTHAEHRPRMAYAMSSMLSERAWPADVDERWLWLLVGLSIYGPIPKKEHRVLHTIYRHLYSLPIAAALPRAATDKLHVVMQRTRLQAMLALRRVCSRNQQLSGKVMRHIIEMPAKIECPTKRMYFGSLAHRQGTRLLQLAILLMDSTDEGHLMELRDHCVQYLLEPSQQFSTKLLVEFILIRLFLTHTKPFSRFIDMQRQLAQARIGSISSWINIVMHVAKVKQSQDLFERVFGLLLPWCTAQNFAVRCSAIAAIKCLWPLANVRIHRKLNYLQALIDFDMETSGNSHKLVDKLCDDFYFAHFHANRHLSLETILKTFPEKTGLCDEEITPVNLFKQHSVSSMPAVCEDRCLVHAPSLIYWSNSKASSNQSAQDERQICTTDMDDSLQRKPQVLRGLPARPQGTSLIVIASLLDKPTNIGGLCRTSEVFGVDKLVVADCNVINDSAFKALSTSSEHWVDIQQVRKSELMEYLNELRTQGYSIVAAEQTTNSIPFASFRFPAKAAILLGEEKCGVPAEMLRYVDHCVEIAQVGLTRSLNVHVTGALFIHKFAEGLLTDL